MNDDITRLVEKREIKFFPKEIRKVTNDIDEELIPYYILYMLNKKHETKFFAKLEKDKIRLTVEPKDQESFEFCFFNIAKFFKFFSL